MSLMAGSHILLKLFPRTGTLSNFLSPSGRSLNQFCLVLQYWLPPRPCSSLSCHHPQGFTGQCRLCKAEMGHPCGPWVPACPAKSYLTTLHGLLQHLTNKDLQNFCPINELVPSSMAADNYTPSQLVEQDVIFLAACSKLVQEAVIAEKNAQRLKRRKAAPPPAAGGSGTHPAVPLPMILQ